MLFFERKEKIRDDDEAFGINIGNRVLYVLRSAALMFFFILAIFFGLAIIEIIEVF